MILCKIYYFGLISEKVKMYASYKIAGTKLILFNFKILIFKLLIPLIKTLLSFTFNCYH